MQELKQSSYLYVSGYNPENSTFEYENSDLFGENDERVKDLAYIFTYPQSQTQAALDRFFLNNSK